MLRRSLLCLSMFLLTSITYCAALNEIRFDGTSGAYANFVELSGTPGESLDGLAIVTMRSYYPGKVESVVRLDGHSFPSDRAFFVVGGPTRWIYPLPCNDLLVDWPYSIGDTVLLVRGLSGTVPANLDADTDGVFDTPTPWTEIVDSVGPDYAPPIYTLETYGGYRSQIYRQNNTGPWIRGGGCDSRGADTPGASNTGIILGGQLGTFDLGDGVRITLTQNGSGYPLHFLYERLPGQPSAIFSGSATSSDSTEIIPDVVATECYYRITRIPSYLSDFRYTIELPISGLSGVSQADKLVIVKRNSGSSEWYPYPTSLNGGALTASGLQSFSEFTVASERQYNSLPVTMSALELE